MRLSLKIALAMTLLTTLILLLVEWTGARREKALFEEDALADCTLVAETMAAALKQVPNLSDADEAVARLFKAIEREESEVDIRWVPAESLWLLPLEQRNAIAEGRAVTLTAPGRRGTLWVHAWVPVIQGWPPGPLSRFSPVSQLMGAVHVSRSLSRRDAFVQRTFWRTTFTVLLVFLSTGVLSLAAGRSIVGRRVDALVRKTQQVAEGNYLSPVPEKGRDELTILARALNRMGGELEEAQRRTRDEVEARIRAEVQLRHVERLTTVGQLAAGVAHELGTPLNVISGRASLVARRSANDPDTLADTRIIQDQTRRITAIIRRLLDFSRRSVPEARPTDLWILAQTSVDLLGSTARKARVDLVLEPPSPPTPALQSSVDPDQLTQVITNLVMNAIQAMPQGGPVTLRVKEEPCTHPLRHPAQRHVHVAVTDQGTGIDPKDLPRIFDPFFTTKEPGEGTGLGLSVVHGILEEHGGAITVQSAPGQGSTFTIHLPPLPSEGETP